MIIAAEDTGLDPSRYPASLVHHPNLALKALSERGYAVRVPHRYHPVRDWSRGRLRIVSKPDHPTSTHPPEPIPEAPI